jgi:hypothetical protein
MTLAVGFVVVLSTIGFLGGVALVVDAIRRLTGDVLKTLRSSRELSKAA